MGETTKIQWADHTFNPWRGCSKIAPGCANCYADAQAKRNPGTLGIWGPTGTRVVAAESMWREPIKWSRDAEKERLRIGNCQYCAERDFDGCEHCQGPFVRPRVFCGSMMDWAEDWTGQLVDSTGTGVLLCDRCGKFHRDNLVSDSDSCTCGRFMQRMEWASLSDVRRRLFRLIDDTPALNWLLLTKRPENIRRMWHGVCPDCGRNKMECGHWPAIAGARNNAWLGTSIACQEDAERNIPHLLKCRDLAPVLFVSIEPLVGQVDLTSWLGEKRVFSRDVDGIMREQVASLDWVIVGGESGPNARPCRVEWSRSIVRQCREAGVNCFVKQLGAKASGLREWCDRCNWGLTFGRHGLDCDRSPVLKDPKGGDPSEWPEDLRVRELPQ